MNAQAAEVVGQLVRPGDIAPVKLDAKLLAEVNQVRADIAALAVEYADMPDVTTKTGLKLAKERKRHVSSLRTRGQAAVKAYTKPLYDAKKEIDTLWREHILVQLKAIEDPISEAIKAEEEKAQRAAAAEAERVRQIQARIAEIRSTAPTLITVEAIDEFVAKLDALDLLETFAEFKNEAILVISDAKRVMAERRQVLTDQQAQADALAEQARDLAEREAKLKQKQAAQQAQPAPQRDQQAPDTPPIMGAARTARPTTGGYSMFRSAPPPAPEQQSAHQPPVDFAEYVVLEADVALIEEYLMSLLQTPEPAFGTDTARAILADVRACIETHLEQAQALVS